MPSRLGKWLLVLVAFAGCYDLTLPPQPGVGPPGLISGRLVWQRPGRLQLEPARGASVFILGSNLAATTNADGRFVIEGLISGEGSLFIRFDGDGDGVRERQRSMLLSDVGAGRGRQISLGDVVLGQSAVVSGRVVRGNLSDPNVHFGTPVFVPGFPLAAVTQDDGAFVLEGLAEGSVQLAAARSGYQAYLSGPLSLRGGEELSLAKVSLALEVESVSGVLRGRVVDAEGAPLSGVTVSTSGSRTVTTDAEGGWRFSGLTVDRYDVSFSAPGRLPAALYNVLVAGPAEVATFDVVLAQGQSPGSTPSLVQEVSMERDAGTFDAGRDAGTFDGGTDAGSDGGVDAGFDAGTDAGFDAGVRVSIGGPMPLTLSFPGGSVGLAAIVMPPPGAATYEWNVSPPGIVMIGNPFSQNTGLTAQSVGAFTLELKVTFGGQDYNAPSVNGVVVGTADAGFDAGTVVALPLAVTDSGATALFAWVECEGPFMPPIVGSVLVSGLQVPSTFAYDGVRRRLVAVFHEPQPSSTANLSATGLRLIDGGVRNLGSIALPTGPLAFGPAALLVDAGLADFNAGATYRPDGLIAVGRLFDGAGCNGCFEVHRESGREASLQANVGPAVPWRRANSAGTSVQAWFSDNSSFKATGVGNTWLTDAPIFFGAVYADGPTLRSLSSSGTFLTSGTYDGGSWGPGETIGVFPQSVSLGRSSGVALAGDRFVQVIDNSGGVEVRKAPSGSNNWQNLGATFPTVLTGITGGRIAATNAGLVMFVEGSGGVTLLHLPNAASTWSTIGFTSKPLDLIGRGSRAYLVAAGASEQLEIFVVDPVSGMLGGILVPASAAVRSAELAASDFGPLGVAWSTEDGGVFQLLMSEIK